MTLMKFPNPDRETTRVLAEAHNTVVKEFESAPGVHKYEDLHKVRLRLAAENEARLIRWARPQVARGYRFEELTQIYHDAPGGVRMLTALGVDKDSKVTERTLFWRRLWRRVSPYGCLGLVVGGEWAFWRKEWREWRRETGEKMG